MNSRTTKNYIKQRHNISVDEDYLALDSMLKKEERFNLKIIIYRLTSPSGKTYVGQTSREYFRKRKHEYDSKNGSNLLIHIAIRKWGWENMEYSVLDEIILDDERETKKIATKLEQYYMEKENSMMPNGYNMIGARVVPMEAVKLGQKRIFFLKNLKCRHETDVVAKKDLIKIWRSIKTLKVKTYEAIGKTAKLTTRRVTTVLRGKMNDNIIIKDEDGFFTFKD